MFSIFSTSTFKWWWRLDDDDYDEWNDDESDDGDDNDDNDDDDGWTSSKVQVVVKSLIDTVTSIFIHMICKGQTNSPLLTSCSNLLLLFNMCLVIFCHLYHLWCDTKMMPYLLLLIF